MPVVYTFNLHDSLSYDLQIFILGGLCYSYSALRNAAYILHEWINDGWLYGWNYILHYPKMGQASRSKGM